MKNYVSPVIDVTVIAAEDIVMLSNLEIEQSGEAKEIGWGSLQ